MIKRLKHNFHTHTIRCNHAVDEDEKYIEVAIENGLKTLGFSDHIPLVREDGRESSYRVPYARCQEYYDSLNGLREKYRNKIDIFIGFEMEYYPEYFDVMLETAKKFKGEYLILGQHFYVAEHKGGKYVLSQEGLGKEDITAYVNSVISAMKTGVFTYVAHPDIVNFVGSDEDYISEMSKICLASKELNIPLELNLLGIRKNRVYPNKLFWKIAGEIGSPVIIGCDAHSAKDVYEITCIEKAFEIVKEFNLNLLEKPNLIRIDK